MSENIPFQKLDEDGGGGGQANSAADDGSGASRPTSLKTSEGRRRSGEPNAGTPLRGDDSLMAKERAEGLRSIVMGFSVFALGMTVALVVQLAAGQGELHPHGAVASTSDVCSELGLSQLRAGANAVDAAITTMLCMGLTHPQYAGIGGGGLMVVHDHGKESDPHTSRLFDFRETMPENYPVEKVRAEAGLGGDPVLSTVVGGLGVGVPGEVRGMEEVHRQLGRMAWPDLFAPVIKMARDGFELAETTHKADMARRAGHMAAMVDHIPNGQAALEAFEAELRPDEDKLVRRTNFADTLQAIADHGAKAFYTGPIAQDIVDTVNQHGGAMSVEDLAGYEAVEREALVGEVGEFEVHAFPTPASGAILLRLLADVQDGKGTFGWDFNEPEFYAAFAKYQKKAFACRAHLGDPKDDPEGMRHFEESLYKRTNGSLPSLDHCQGSPGEEVEKKGTSHISVVDSDELYVSVSTSMNWWFGSLLVAPNTGILLNSHMADFDWSDGADANGPAAGKRPLSGMSPSVVFHRDRPCKARFAIGGVNATKITAGVAQVTSNIITFGQSAEAALDAPRLFCSTTKCQLQNYPAKFAPHTAQDFVQQIRASVGDGVSVELLEETSQESSANQQCSVVALAGRPNNDSVLEARTDTYLDWGGAVY